MRARVLRERCAGCGAKWSLGVDAIVHAHDMEPSYRDWQGRHAACRDRISDQPTASAAQPTTLTGRLRRLFARATAPAT